MFCTEIKVFIPKANSGLFSNILSSSLSKNEKQIKLKDIADKSVDIKGIGFYTLGKKEKKLHQINLNLMNLYLKIISLRVLHQD